MKILISGATGFFGSRLVKMLREKHDVFAMARILPVKKEDQAIHWIEQDFTKPFNVSLFPEKLDAVLHLSQSRFYKLFPEKSADIFMVNVYGTFQLLEIARKTGVQHFLYASSGGVYGYSYERLMETHPVHPLNFYLSSKHMAELLIGNYRHFFKTVVFRFFFVYGKGQKDMLIPTLVEKIKSGEKIVIEGNTGPRINPIHVEDALRVFEPALQLQNHGLFNVTGNEVVTIAELVHLLEKILKKKAVIQTMPGYTGGDLVGDNSRMKEILDVVPQNILFEGLRCMVE